MAEEKTKLQPLNMNASHDTNTLRWNINVAQDWIKRNLKDRFHDHQQ